jgi:hypothetical protein
VSCLIDGLLAAPDRDVRFEIESNASIDRLVRACEEESTCVLRSGGRALY